MGIYVERRYNWEIPTFVSVSVPTLSLLSEPVGVNKLRPDVL